MTELQQNNHGPYVDAAFELDHRTLVEKVEKLKHLPESADVRIVDDTCRELYVALMSVLATFCDIGETYGANYENFYWHILYAADSAAMVAKKGPDRFAQNIEKLAREMDEIHQKIMQSEA